jgi:hypothetical protein
MIVTKTLLPRNSSYTVSLTMCRASVASTEANTLLPLGQRNTSFRALEEPPRLSWLRSKMGLLAGSPFDLLRLIVADLDYYFSKSFSFVNINCRSVRTSEIFHTLKVDFSSGTVRESTSL